MTETLIERLRAYANSPGMWNAGQPQMATDAADALERMTERYRVLDETYGHTVGDLNEAQAALTVAQARIEHCGELLGRSEQECERAQARIERLERVWRRPADYPDPDLETAMLEGENKRLRQALEAVMAEYREGYGLRCIDQVRAALSPDRQTPEGGEE